jgi:predicted metal-binding membrane protein
MALLFVGGVMNLAWVAGITVYVFLEKVMPKANWLSYATGIALLAGAVFVWFSAA